MLGETSAKKDENERGARAKRGKRRGAQHETSALHVAENVQCQAYSVSQSGVDGVVRSRYWWKRRRERLKSQALVLLSTFI